MTDAPRLRLASVRFAGVRTLADVELALGPMTVLVGENGSGKSTILECFELLRRTSQASFIDDFHLVHGGTGRLLRHGGDRIALEARFAAMDEDVVYAYRIEIAGGRVHAESLAMQPEGGEPEVLLVHSASGSRVREEDGTLVEIQRRETERTLLSAAPLDLHPGIAMVAEALSNIEVQVGFDVLAPWATGGEIHRPSARAPVIVRPAARLGRLGSNLPNVFQTLRNVGDDAWRDTMSLVRLGLGDWVDSVVLTPTADGGSIALAIKPRGVDTSIPAVSLSDGQLAYLAFVALVKSPGQRSVLAIDEPELHLHPALASRVLDALVGTSQGAPLVLATHSRRLLDQLEDPAAATVVCAVGPGFPQTTVLRRFDPDALEGWLGEYDGLGSVLDAGYGAAVMDEAGE